MNFCFAVSEFWSRYSRMDQVKFLKTVIHNFTWSILEYVDPFKYWKNIGLLLYKETYTPISHKYQTRRSEILLRNLLWKLAMDNVTSLFLNQMSRILLTQLLEILENIKETRWRKRLTFYFLLSNNFSVLFVFSTSGENLMETRFM